MKNKIIERNSMLVNLIVNMIMAVAGVWVFIVTDIQALFLDFFFSFLAMLSSISAVAISKVSKKRTKHYPDGLYYLEPLYAILKSLLTLVLLIFSVFNTSISAYNYFIKGIGEVMNIGPVLPYTGLMVILCFGLSFFNYSQNKKINNVSTILTAETKTTFIDGLMSLGIGIAVVILSLIEVNSSLGFLYYTGDFFITLTLVILTIKEPIKVIISAFRELSGGTIKDKDMQVSVYKTVHTHLNGLSNEATCDIFKIGMHIKVRINLHNEINDASALIKAKENILFDLNKIYENIEITFSM